MDDTDESLLANVLIPVAHDDDAHKTARALEPYNPTRVTALHVVEKADGAMDKTSVEQSEEIAADAYDAVRTVFPSAETHTAYGRDVPGTILDVASELDVSAIAYRSRGGNRLLQFLSGDQSLKLITKADRPVIALPRVEPEE